MKVVNATGISSGRMDYCRVSSKLVRYFVFSKINAPNQ
jgi:hypothetical protein